MSLDLVDFDEMRKPYKINGETYKLKPPIWSICDKAMAITKQIMTLFNGDETKERLKEYAKEKGLESISMETAMSIFDIYESMKDILSEVRKLQVKFLKLVLEDGDLNKINVDNVRQDIFTRVQNDFFSQFGL